MVPYRGRAALAPPSCSPALERLDLGQHALSVILGRAGRGGVPGSSLVPCAVLLAVVIVTGWVTTVYSNFKEEDTMSSREPASVLVLADVESSAAHTRVTDQILAYLRAVGSVDKVYYVRDARDGPRPGESVESWWRRALRDQKVIKDGSVIFFPGPPSSPKVS